MLRNIIIIELRKYTRIIFRNVSRIFSSFVLIRVYSMTVFFLAITSLSAQTVFTLKSAPENIEVFFNGEPLRPVTPLQNGLRNFRLPSEGILRFSANGYLPLEYHSSVLPVRNNIAGIKLENQNSLFRPAGEYSTGSRPKSAYWSPDGQRLFVPLLEQHGVDVFRLSGARLVFEKRLAVPGSGAHGFVEALCDERRRELWVSNMEENKVHIFNLDTLEYKSSHNTGGALPKVIVQSPDGSITAVSNWISKNLSIFDSGTKRLLRVISVGGTPRGMAFSPDGTLLYTAIYDEPVIEAVNMAQNRVVNRFRLYSGQGAMRHVIFRDGKLYASDMYRGTVNILNAQTGALLHTRRIGPNINTIILSPDGKTIFASSRGRNNPEDYTKPGPDFGAVYILNAENLATQERIWGRNQPTGLAVSPDGRFLAFTDFLDDNLELYAVRERQ